MIGPGTLEELLAASPYNIVRLILPAISLDAHAAGAVAASRLGSWLASGVLGADASPALYVYEQNGPGFVQRGLIGLAGVDAPAAAVSAADTLIWDVMRDRGYPADNRDASLDALSVYHARPLDGYRQAQEIKTESASTEELRTTLISYRALFQDLVGVPVGQHVFARRAAATSGPAADSDGRARKTAIVPSKTADTPR